MDENFESFTVLKGTGTGLACSGRCFPADVYVKQDYELRCKGCTVAAITSGETCHIMSSTRASSREAQWSVKLWPKVKALKAIPTGNFRHKFLWDWGRTTLPLMHKVDPLFLGLQIVTVLSTMRFGLEWAESMNAKLQKAGSEESAGQKSSLEVSVETELSELFLRFSAE